METILSFPQRHALRSLSQTDSDCFQRVANLYISKLDWNDRSSGDQLVTAICHESTNNSLQPPIFLCRNEVSAVLVLWYDSQH